MEYRWNDTDRGNRTSRTETCSSATFFQNKSHMDQIPGWNPDLHFERLATNRLNHGMTLLKQLIPDTYVI
jgi:hypothetical protein